MALCEWVIVDIVPPAKRRDPPRSEIYAEQGKPVSGGVKIVRIGRFEIHNRSLPVGGVIQASIWSFMR